MATWATTGWPTAKAVLFKRLNELYAANGQVGFQSSERVDGKLVLAEAAKVLAMKSA